jgi:cobalt-zinc-cadmium efflux system outer membrane protein
MVEVSVPLELFRRSARTEVADREVTVAEQSLSEQVRALVNDVRLRYGRAAAAARDVGTAESLTSAANSDLELLRRRVEEGGAPPLDRDRLIVEVSNLEAARRRAIGRVEVAFLELRRSLGLNPSTSLRLKSTLETLTANPISSVGPDAGQRSDVRTLNAQVELSAARLAQAEAEGRFDVSLFGSYSRMNAGFPQRGFDPEGTLERVHGIFHYLSAGAMVSVPLWNRNQGAVDAARAEQAAAQAKLEAVRLSAEMEIAAGKALVAQTRLARDALAGGVAVARSNLEVMRQTYELGRATLPEVLAEQRRYLEAENAYTNALREAFEAHASLQFARGEIQ